MRPVFLVVLASLALPAVASAAPGLVVGKRLAGASLGGSEAALTKRWGEPSRVLRRPNPFFGTERRLVFTARKLAATTGPDGDTPTVLLLTTRNRSHRTSRGVGIGSRRSVVRRRLRGVRCERRLCHVGQFRPGKTVTSFRFDRRWRVDRIDLGLVLD